MKVKQQLDCNLPLTGTRVRLQRLKSAHVDLLSDSFANDSFWNIYRINQNRQQSRAELIQQLEFEYERVPGQVGKIEWLIEKRLNPAKDSETASLGIEKVRPIGLASLSAFDVSNKQAEFMIGFFNNEDIVAGLGLEASLLVLSYAFNSANLNRLLSYVYSSNTAAQRNTLSLGFVNKGILNAHLHVQSSGRYYDVYQNELLDDDFRQSRRLSRLSRRLLGYDVTAEQQRLEQSATEKSHTGGLSASFKLER